MVTLSVPKLGHRRPTCYAYPILFQAHQDVSRGQHVLAGIKLLESARRYLVALCECYEIDPPGSNERMVRLLSEAGQLEECAAVWLRDIIDMGERCQRCAYVKPSLIETGIDLMALMLNHSPELELPTRGGAL